MCLDKMQVHSKSIGSDTYVQISLEVSLDPKDLLLDDALAFLHGNAGIDL